MVGTLHDAPSLSGSLSSLLPSFNSTRSRLSPQAASVGRWICLAIFTLGAVMLFPSFHTRRIPPGMSPADTQLYGRPSENPGRFPPRAPAGSSNCPNSLRDTRGLICVRNQLWASILRQDEASWLRIRANIGRLRRLADVRQAIWVPTFSCPFEQRIGELADGGKWVCNAPKVGLSKRWNRGNDGCLVYGFGIGGKFGFETQLLNTTNNRCEVHLFDPGASRWKAPRLKGLHIYEYGLTKNSSETPKLKSYTTFLKKLSHEQRTVNLLKMDIEGSERAALPEIAALPNYMRPQQILVELHWRPEFIRPMNNILIQLREAGYVMFHMEPNFYCGGCTEVSFLHLDSRTMV